MQSGLNLSGRSMLSASSTVTVAGVQRDHVSVSLDSTTGGEIPGLDGGGIFAATGSIQWTRTRTSRATDSPINDRSRSPWTRVGGWPPNIGDAVTIDATVTDTETGESVTCRLFTGKIAGTSGGPRSAMVSKVIDHTDRLKQPYSCAPLQYAMPAGANGGAAGSPPVPVQLSPMHVVCDALARAGFNPSTPLGTSTRLYIPGQGSFLPRVGYLSKDTTASTLFASPIISKWGSGTLVPLNSDGTTSKIKITAPAAGSPFPSAGAHEITVDLPGRPDLSVEDPGSGQTSGDRSSRLVVDPGSFGEFEVWRSASGGTIQVRSGTTTLAQSGVNAAENVRVAVRFTQASDGAEIIGVLQVLRESGALSTQVQFTMPGGQRAAGNITPVSVVPWQGAFGAIVYRIGATAWVDLNRTPTARIELESVGTAASSWSSLIPLRAFPRWPGQAAVGTVLDLVKEASTALCAAVWLDEYGLFRWKDARLATGQTWSETYFADQSLIDLDWDDDGDHRRSSVRVEFRQPAITGGSRSGNPWAVLWKGNGDTYSGADDPPELWLKPEADEDWIRPSVDFLVKGANFSTTDLAQINSGTRSVILYSNDGDQAGMSLSASVEHVTDETYILSIFRSGGNATGRVVFKTPTGVAGLNRGGEDSPILRGWSRIRWADNFREVAGTWTGEMPAAYTHDAGPWIGTGAVAQRQANWMRDRTSTPVAMARTVKIRPDIRIQLQDKILIRDPDILGVAIAGVVIGKNITIGDGKVEQTLTIRMTGITQLGVTYDDVDEAGGTYNQLDAPTRTYDQFDLNPLGA